MRAPSKVAADIASAVDRRIGRGEPATLPVRIT
jgi:hypothetical protein